MSKTFESISVGEELGPLELFVSRDQCRNYARTCAMEAPRFMDDEGAKLEGLPGMILPGNMSLGLITRLLTDWIGSGPARIARIGATYRVPVQPDHTLTIHGFITHIHPENRSIEIDLWLENEEADRLVTGAATVEFTK